MTLLPSDRFSTKSVVWGGLEEVCSSIFSWGKPLFSQRARGPPTRKHLEWVGLGGIQWEGHKQERPKGRKDGDTHRKGLRGGTMAPVSGTGVQAQAMMGGREKKQPFSVRPLGSAVSYH